MANDKNIHAFNAADIEKYHKGLLSNTERHALEKAALDDPFLADALEGYALPNLNTSADIAALKQQLANRVEERQAKVVPLGGGKQNSFPWLRAAVAVLIIGGAGLLANQFLFNNDKKGNIAQTDKNSSIPATHPDSVSPANTNSNTAAEIKTNGGSSATTTVVTEDKLTGKAVSTTPGSAAPVTGENNHVSGERRTDDIVNVKPAPVTAEAEKISEEKKLKATNAPAEIKDIAKSEDNKNIAAQNNVSVIGETRSKDKAVPDADGAKEQAEKTAALKRKTDEQRYLNQHNNIFRGRVTDANNAGVPFANVTNVEDKAGTYTDVNGYFNLTSPDTVLNVQVRSVGFENNQIQLRNAVANNKVILHEDRNLSTVVISNQKPNVAARNRDANRTLQEPEPADGWDNYDTYLANNLDIPEDLKTKQNTSGSVQVSFEVDKYGEPINIRVEKSLCDKCDKEAIRLIKDGPKWKRNASTKGRTTVTINF
jgi:hypothetical protein